MRQMWKQAEAPSFSPAEEQSHPASAIPVARLTGLGTASVIDQACIASSITIVGEITGSESLFIDGCVEGNVNLPDNHVTIGKNGQIRGNIAASDIVVMGSVRGNVTASNRVDIRADGNVTGEVVAARLSVEVGASCTGRFNIHLNSAELADNADSIANRSDRARKQRAVQPEVGNLRMRPVPMSA